MNKLVLSCVLIASKVNTIRIETDTEAPFVEINVTAPDDFEEEDGAFVEINVGDVDAVDFSGDQSLSDEEIA